MPPFLQLLLVLTIIITAAKTDGWLSQKLRQPAVPGILFVLPVTHVRGLRP